MGSSDEACPHLQSSYLAAGASGHSSFWLEAPEKGIYGSRILTFSWCLGLVSFPLHWRLESQKSLLKQESLEKILFSTAGCSEDFILKETACHFGGFCRSLPHLHVSWWQEPTGHSGQEVAWCGAEQLSPGSLL